MREESSLELYKRNSGFWDVDLNQEVYNIAKQKKRYEQWQIEYNQKCKQAEYFYLREKLKLLEADNLDLKKELTNTIGLIGEPLTHQFMRELVFQEKNQKAHLQYIEELKSINLSHDKYLQSIYYDLGESTVLLKKLACNFVDTLLNNVERPELSIYFEITVIDRPLHENHPDFNSFSYMIDDDTKEYVCEGSSGTCSNVADIKAGLLEEIDDKELYEYYVLSVKFQARGYLTEEQAQKVQSNYDQQGGYNLLE